MRSIKALPYILVHFILSNQRSQLFQLNQIILLFNLITLFYFNKITTFFLIVIYIIARYLCIYKLIFFIFIFFIRRVLLPASTNTIRIFLVQAYKQSQLSINSVKFRDMIIKNFLKIFPQASFNIFTSLIISLLSERFLKSPNTLFDLLENWFLKICTYYIMIKKSALKSLFTLPLNIIIWALVLSFQISDIANLFHSSMTDVL